MIGRILIRTRIACIAAILINIPIVFAQPETLWTKTYGGNSWEGGTSVQQTSDGGYIITGWTRSYGAGESDVWLIKTNASGDTLWTRTFGGSLSDAASCVQQTFDGGYIIVGKTRSYGAGEVDVWLIKTDVSGDTLWTKTFGGSNSGAGNSIQQTSDGGYIILGGYSLYGGWEYYDSPVWLIKTDALGDTLWTKNLLVSLSYAGFGSSVQQTSDGGYIITGGTSVYEYSDSDVWLIKTDTSGNTLWTKTFGEKYSNEFGYSVQQTFDGGYIITGSTNSYGASDADVWLIKTDSFGDTLWTMTYGGSRSEWGRSVQQTSDGGYIVLGNKSFFLNTDIWLIRVAPDTVQVAVEDSPKLYPSSFYLHQNYPNPFNPITTLRYDLLERSDVTLTIYDILGRQVRTLVQGMEEPGYKSVTWDGTNDLGEGVSAGVYLYRIQASDPSPGSGQGFAQTRKMVLLR